MPALRQSLECARLKLWYNSATQTTGFTEAIFALLLDPYSSFTRPPLPPADLAGLSLLALVLGGLLLLL